MITNTDAEGITVLAQEGTTKLTVSKVGQSGDYNDLLYKPDLTIFAKDEEVVKSINNIQPDSNGNVALPSTGGVQSDWNENNEDNPAFIQNKPDYMTKEEIRGFNDPAGYTLFINDVGEGNAPSLRVEYKDGTIGYKEIPEIVDFDRATAIFFDGIDLQSFACFFLFHLPGNRIPPPLQCYPSPFG